MLVIIIIIIIVIIIIIIIIIIIYYYYLLLLFLLLFYFFLRSSCFYPVFAIHIPSHLAGAFVAQSAGLVCLVASGHCRNPFTLQH
jgi:hypothetical protein